MPRPERVEFKEAIYHVMNRGIGRRKIFANDNQYQIFLEILAEAQERFGLVIHCYCLMGNNYQLLIETPKANLSRAMRHINGVYTLRYNQLKNTDGRVFPGRFKSVVIEADSFLLPLSRYIHRAPIETKRNLVDNLSDYPWSSYKAYTQPGTKPDWVTTEKAHGILGKRQKYTGYKAYVEQGNDEDTLSHYNKGNMASVLGSNKFIEKIKKLKKQAKSKNKQKPTVKPVSQKEIIKIVANAYKTIPNNIVKPKQGRPVSNMPRKVAMYCCQRYGDYKLREIAVFFGLKNPGSASRTLNDIKVLIKNGELKTKIRFIDKAIKSKRT